MKFNKIILIATSLLMITTCYSQDMYPVKQLTFNIAQEGFATWSPDGMSILYQYTDLYDTLGRNGLWKAAQDGIGAKQIFRGLAEHAKWSPDGSQIAFLERKGLSICIYNMKDDEIKSIFSKEGFLLLPGCWSKDGEYVLVRLWDRPARKSTIWKISFDGKEKIQITGHNENFFRHLALSPDGSLLVYAALEGKYLGLWIMPAGGGKSIPLAVTPNAHNEGAVWSPDGNSIAFTSTRSGSFDIWIMDANIEQVKKEPRELND